MSRIHLDNADWKELGRGIQKFLKGRVPNWDVKDLTQEVIATAFENGDQFDPAKSSSELTLEQKLSAWLAGIAKYKLIAYYKTRRREKLLLELVSDESFETLNEVRLSCESKLAVDDLLEAMKEALKDCTPSMLEVAKPYFQCKDCEQIASELGVSKDSVYGRLSRLRKKLKQRVGKLKAVEMEPQVIYASEVNLYQAVNQFIDQQTMTGCQWGDNNSLQNYNGFVDQLSSLDDQTRDQLKQARAQIEKGDLPGEDKEYVTGELNSLTKELQKKKPRWSTLRRIWKHIQEVTPHIASILSSTATLAKIFKP